MKATIKNRKKSFCKIMIISIMLVTFIQNSSAQKIIKAIEVASDVTGSGLGGNIYIGTTLIRGNSAFSLGANLQHKKFNFSGMQMNYRYAVTSSDNGKLELFFLVNMTLHAAANISNKSIKVEKMCRPEETNNYNALSLKVIESYLGFGLKYNFTQKLSTIGSIGVGGYETLNRDYDRMMYRPKSAMSLRFRVGLAYNITKNNNNHFKK